MNEEPILRGILESPRLGRFRVPLDIFPLIVVLLFGFLARLSLATVILLCLAFAMIGWKIRKQGEGYVRGILFYAVSKRVFLPTGKPIPRFRTGFPGEDYS